MFLGRLWRVLFTDPDPTLFDRRDVDAATGRRLDRIPLSELPREERFRVAEPSAVKRGPAWSPRWTSRAGIRNATDRRQIEQFRRIRNVLL